MIAAILCDVTFTLIAERVTELCSQFHFGLQNTFEKHLHPKGQNLTIFRLTPQSFYKHIHVKS